MIKLTDEVLENIYKHIETELPREACGVVIVEIGKQVYIPCRNISENKKDFILSPEDYANAEDRGGIILVVHSHPFISPQPSQADLVGCESSKLPWLIINWPTKASHYFEPNGYKAPLIGREFSQGILDCLTLIQDYYKDNLNIDLKSPWFRAEKWWEREENRYVESAPENGFFPVVEPILHDVLLMQVGSPVPNHAAVWVGDNKILHHQLGRLSTIDVYGGWYRKVTTHVFRHKDAVK
jgi:proteasome lid subunit RPN8/RPN11